MAGNIKDPVQFWQELKQRKVVRAMTVYIAGAFALLQAVDMVFPRIGLPSWTVTLAIVLLAAGLVVVVILTWIYDITPEGIRRTSNIDKAAEVDKADVEFVLPGWESTVSQSSEEMISYNNVLYSKNDLQNRKKGRIYSFSSFIVIIAVAILFTFSSANTVPFTERDWVLITDFENLTSNTVFDKSLYTAFSLTANQSRYINILPRSRMLATMARMEIIDRESVDDETGREIAVREGIDIYIVPSISEVGNKFVIAAKIMDSNSGDLLRSEVIYAENQDEILGKLDILSKRMRRHLGESRYKIASQDKQLADVTTSSLEALKLYSQGIDCHLMLKFEDAKKYYESALKIDTGFTSARASLGNILIERFDPVKGRELLSQAVKHVDNLTERERLGILAFYASNVENNYLKAIQYNNTRIELYPDDAAARNNAGWYYQNTHDYEKAVREYKEAARIDKNMTLPVGGLIWIYQVYLGEPDSSLIWSLKLIEQSPQSAWGYLYLGSAYASLDSLEKAKENFFKGCEIDPGFTMCQYRLAHTCLALHQHPEAIKTLEKIIELNKDEISAYYEIGVNYHVMGKKKQAAEYFRKYLLIGEKEYMSKYPELAETYISLGTASARLNDTVSSVKMLKKALGIDTTLYERYAGFYCQMGKIPEAMDWLEKALNNGYRDLYWLKQNPSFMELQNETRFRTLLKQYFNK